MNKRKFLAKIMTNRKNIRYSDFITLLIAFGFYHTRSDGSHNIFKHNSITEFINVQNVNGEAKPYQIKQFLALVEKYNLKMEDTN